MSRWKIFSSRFVLATSLALSMSSIALADRAFVPDPPTSHFAQAPGHQEQVLDRRAVRAALARAREANLVAFRAYQQAGVFPSNTYENRELNVWRDRDGHLCAAATIIDASGQHELVQRTAEQSNFIRLADVKQGPLMDWILTSGLTQDEIVLIQRPFDPVTSPRRPPEVDPKLRASEDARLRAKYTAISKTLVANESKSLDTATDRLMQHPQLAWRVLGVTD